MEGRRSWRSRVEDGFEVWAHWVLRQRWWIAVAMVAAALALGAQIPRLELETAMDSFLDEADPIRIRYEAFREQFGRDERIVIAVEPPEVFDATFLRKLAQFHQSLEDEVPKVEQVTSLINIRHTRGEHDELVVDDLLAEIPETPEAMAELRERALASPLYRDLVLSADGRHTAVIIENEAYSSLGAPPDALGGFDEAGDVASADAGEGASSESAPRPFLSGSETLAIVDAVFAVVEAYDAPDFRLRVAGSPVLTVAVQRMMMRDMSVYLAAALVAIVALLWILLKRVWGVVLPLICVVLPILATLGLMPILGTPFTVPMQIIPTFLLAVGIGYAVHILVSFYRRFDATGDRAASLVHALRQTGLPIAMTALTTAVGLVSFATAELSPIKDFGVFAPLGAALACLYAVSLLPALLAILPMRPRVSGGVGDAEAGGAEAARNAEGASSGFTHSEVSAGDDRDAVGAGPIDRALVGVVSFSTRHPWKVLAAGAMVVVLSALGVTRLGIAHDPLSWLDPEDPVRTAVEFIDAKLGGAMSLELVLDTGRDNGLYEPSVLQRMDAIDQRTQQLVAEGVPLGKTVSVVQVVKETHQALNENRPEFYAIPDSRELVAQELLLFENSGSDDLEELVDTRFSKARLTIKAPWLDAAEYEQFMGRVEEEYHALVGPDLQLVTTGLMAMMSETMVAVTQSLSRSYGLAFLLITPLMMLLIGSLRGGAISMVPNLLPILATLGVMGWAGIPLDTFTLLVGCIAVGLAVDDTIHFIHAFHRQEALGLPAERALNEVARTTGRALLFTSVVLASALSIFALSSLQSIFAFGLLTSFAIVTAFVADVTVTPALLLLTSPGRVPETPEAAEAPTASLLERLGGARTLDAIVDAYHDRVLSDPQLAPHFASVDMERRAGELRAALQEACSGAAVAAEPPALLPAARDATPTEIAACAQHLLEALRDLGQPTAAVEEMRKRLAVGGEGAAR